MTIVTGLGATATMDIWSAARQTIFGVPAPDFGLVGRWLGHMTQGRFRHGRIADAEAQPGEQVLGWGAHYLIGIAFAGLLPLFGGTTWFEQPTPGLALIIGIATVAAPFLILQPAIGAGLAARRTPYPWQARAQSVINHAVFGLGLFLSARVAHWLIC